jgi:predicted nuclease of predicted toxin-antitoxin system
MRFLANETFPAATVAALKRASHDVAWVRMTTPGDSDREVLAWAAAEGRVLLTFDKGFGQVAASSALPEACGVVLIRMPILEPGAFGERVADLIMARSDWAGHFSVIEPGRIRRRRLGR